MDEVEDLHYEISWGSELRLLPNVERKCEWQRQRFFSILHGRLVYHAAFRGFEWAD